MDEASAPAPISGGYRMSDPTVVVRKLAIPSPLLPQHPVFYPTRGAFTRWDANISSPEVPAETNLGRESPYRVVLVLFLKDGGFLVDLRVPRHAHLHPLPSVSSSPGVSPYIGSGCSVEPM